MNMSSLMVRTDVTAVKLHKNLILAGIGSYLNVFSKTSSYLLQRLHCLNGQKVYGIVPSFHTNKIIVFGGKQFTVVSENVEFERLLNPLVCDDWLHSSIWITCDKIAVLTAHNVVQIWDTKTASLQTQYASKENSILYSGALHPLHDDVLVFAGTVFSEVIIQACKCEEPLHYLKGHRGVIFSICCDAKKGIIVTTSDDRSVCIWSINNMKSLAKASHDTIEFWQLADIVRTQEVYGHTARVMRSCISKDMIVSVGEDSAICFWGYDGKLLKKILTHQNSGIWSVNADDDHIVTGGGDGSVIVHPLTTATDHGQTQILNIDEGTPKKIVFTARKNIIILNDKDDLIHYDVKTESKAVYKLKHESTYKLISLSSCKQMIAVADMNGNLDVFVENCKDEAKLLNIVNCKLDFGNILSLHWAGNRHLVLGCEGGLIKVLASNGNKIEDFAEFLLPNCKERWLTACSIDSASKMFIVGDRQGNIHVFKRGIKTPVKSFSKVHGRYGPTSIVMKKNVFITTGRDGTIKFFDLNNEEKYIAKYMSSKDLEFQWVEKFIDHNENMICGFQERVFIVYDLKNNGKLVEVACGGGHRSWDAVRYIEKVNDDFEECVKCMFVKNSDIHIHTFQLSKTVATNIVSGSHCKEINCLEVVKIGSHYFCISGGEDTTLRLSSLKAIDLQDKVIFKNLSNVRTLKTKCLGDNKYILVSAGGRAQICIKILNFFKESDDVVIKSENLVDYMIKGPEKERKGKQSWKNCTIDFDPETRIMDIDLMQVNQDNFIIFAGCSDSRLRIFKLNITNADFKQVKDINNHKTCILKIRHIKFNDKNLLLTCSTRGEVIIWDINQEEGEIIDVEALFTTNTNKSGINSFDVKNISKNHILFATGGDDNAIHLNLIKINDQNENFDINICDKITIDNFHCSQITGLVLLDDVLISTSIDQRVTLCKWSVNDGVIKYKFLFQSYSDVSDIQGMNLVYYSSKYIRVCVYGKGVEILDIDIPT